MTAVDWLPPGKSCAICFSIDDVHPGRVDRAGGALRHVLHLVERHPQLKTSLCVTADWRPRSPYPTRRLLGAVPALARHFYLAKRWPAGTMRLDRHPEFVALLKSIPGAEMVPHGLHHIQKGLNGPAEFERADYDDCRAKLGEIDSIMAAADLPAAKGHSPPGWAAPRPFRLAMRDHGLQFVASARDVRTPVSAEARTSMSGLSGQPLIRPALTEEGLVHITANFQATSDLDRAFAILACRGLLSIKAHFVKRVGSYVALDGLDAGYAAYLDSVLDRCTARFGESIWWASMGAVAERFLAAAGTRAAAAS